MKYILKKLFWGIVRPMQYVYWFLVRPHTRGVKCLVEYNNTFLLARLNYAHKLWTVPGGGVKKDESFEQAARREIFEEVGVTPQDLVKIGEYMNTHQYKIDKVEVYYGKVDRPDTVIDGFEISEACWFAVDQLPPDRSPGVNRVLKFAGILS